MASSYSSSSSNRGASEYIELSKKIKTYVDISLSFKPSPITNDITLLTNENAINNAIKNIILFLPSEVPFNAEVGSTTQSFLFDQMDEVTSGLIATEVRRAILYCEPRVTFVPLNPALNSIGEYRNSTARTLASDKFNADTLGVYVNFQPDQNSFEVTVKYRIVGGEQTFRVQEILTPTR